MNAQLYICLSKLQKFSAVNCHRSRSTLYLNTLTRQLIKRLTLVLEGRIHRRNLLNFANKCLECIRHLRLSNRGGIYLRDNLTIRVSCLRRNTKPDTRPIGFVSIQQVLRKFGGFTKTQGQNTCCQRIQTARVSYLLRAKQALRLLHNIIGRDACGFIHDQYSINRSSLAPPSQGLRVAVLPRRRFVNSHLRALLILRHSLSD